MNVPPPGTSIDLISEEAGVSTRTIYNHFENKLGLFSAVLLASATCVADAFIEQVDAGFSGADPESDLIVLPGDRRSPRAFP